MKTVKFTVPATYKDSEGNVHEYENAGQVVEVPEADAKHFEQKGWSSEGKKSKG